jgi:hypothetical protein
VNEHVEIQEVNGGPSPEIQEGNEKPLVRIIDDHEIGKEFFAFNIVAAGGAPPFLRFDVFKDTVVQKLLRAEPLDVNSRELPSSLKSHDLVKRETGSTYVYYSFEEEEKGFYLDSLVFESYDDLMDAIKFYTKTYIELKEEEKRNKEESEGLVESDDLPF